MGYSNWFSVGFYFGLILSWICDEFSDLFELVCFVWVFSLQICHEFSTWVCFGLNQGREKESRLVREI